MGKKYLETKKDSLESSILGVWQTAIEEGEAIRDAAQMTKEVPKEVTKEEVELDEQVDAFFEHIIEMSDDNFDKLLEDYSDEELITLEAFFAKTIGKIAKAAGKGVVKVAKRFGTDKGRTAGIQKKIDKLKGKQTDRAALTKAKGDLAGLKKKKTPDAGAAVAPKTKGKETPAPAAAAPPKKKVVAPKKKAKKKTGGKTPAGLSSPKPRNVGSENYTEASGDKEAYKKFFNSALKKFKVSSPAELKGDDKKKFFDYIDKNWEGDNEKAEAAMSQVREFKVQSMKTALAQVWGIAEGELPPALKKAIDAKKKDKEEKDEDKILKNGGKTLTGKKAAEIDINPEIKDR